MPLPIVLGRLIERRLSALGRHLRRALDGDVTAVHQARVATRRLREALPLAAAFAPRKDVTRAVRVARRITRALGPVRELDVALCLLADFEQAHPSLAVAVGATRAHIGEDRDRRRRAMLEQVHREDAARLMRRVERLASDAKPAGAAWRRLLADRAERRGKALAETIEAAGTLYTAERLHGVRIAAKRLRYVLELAGETRSAGVAREVAELKRAQDVLGELHDLQVLVHYASGAPGAGTGDAPTALIGPIEDECRRLHAVYLSRRARLGGVVRETVGRIVRTLRRASRGTPVGARQTAAMG